MWGLCLVHLCLDTPANPGAVWVPVPAQLLSVTVAAALARVSPSRWGPSASAVTAPGASTAPALCSFHRCRWLRCRPPRHPPSIVVVIYLCRGSAWEHPPGQGSFRADAAQVGTRSASGVNAECPCSDSAVPSRASSTQPAP